MSQKLLLILTLGALPLSLLAQPKSEPLKSGDPIPDSALKTADDENVSLRKLVSEKPAVLIFYRGGWCPYCTRHLRDLARIEKDVLAAGDQLLAISADRPSKLREKPDYQKLNYTLLSDNSMDAARAFGIGFEVPADLVKKYKNEYGIDLEAASGRTHHLLPHPAVFVVDMRGIVRFAHVSKDYKVRLESQKILEEARATR
jgi:peroxiredoxin